MVRLFPNPSPQTPRLCARGRLRCSKPHDPLDWKIKAMRVCVWVEKHHIITRAQFKKLGIDPSRWMNGHWLAAGDNRGDWVAGKSFPANQMRLEHPNIYEKIEAGIAEWSGQKVTQ